VSRDTGTKHRHTKRNRIHHVEQREHAVRDRLQIDGQERNPAQPLQHISMRRGASTRRRTD